jgi:hypothetical protein
VSPRRIEAIKNALWGFAMAALLVTLVPAACSPSQRDRAISTTYASLNAASSAFLTFDRQHQAELIAAAPDKLSAQADLTNYRARRAPVQDSFVAAYRALIAATLLKDDLSLSNAVQAAALVAESLADFGVKVTP